MDNKLLIVTSKWPGKTNNYDGGNSTVRELIDILRTQYIIDILYFGDHNEIGLIEGVHDVICFHHDVNHYESYGKTDTNVFSIRMKQADISAKAIEAAADSYNRIIVIHALFLLGVDSNNKELLNKVVLFPMFTGEDYRNSGEIVPDEYILKETMLFSKVKSIVVPSQSGKQTLTRLYGANEEIIHVIYRCVDRFSYTEHCIKSDAIHIIYIASVRKQKSHIEAVYLLKKLADYGVNAHLTCIGAIQDRTIYSHCVDTAEQLGISERLSFTGDLEYDDLRDLIIKADINISVSKWETFGRGIFEGLVAGVPTVVLSRIESVKEFANRYASPRLCGSLDEMASCICELIDNKIQYSNESKNGKKLRGVFSVNSVLEQLNNALV